MKKLSATAICIVLVLFIFKPSEGGAWSPIALQLIGDLSDSQEVEIGRQAAQEIERQMPVLKNPTIENYLNGLGRRLASNSDRPDLTYRFRVIDQEEANAFALPGGFIYVFRGIIRLSENESELAGVLAHEIAHVSERHGVEQVKRAQRLGLGLGLLDMILGRDRGTAGSLTAIGAGLVAQGYYLKHSREAEREADREGVHMLRKTGISPRGMITLFERIEELSGRQPRLVGDFLSSHPSLEERRGNIGDLLRTTDSRLRTDTREFQQIRRLAGGPLPSQQGR